MKTSTTALRYVVIALIVLILGGLWGLYSYLRSARDQTSAQNSARGYGSAQPVFEGSSGSTYQNAASTLGSAGISTGTSTQRLWEVSAVPVAGFGWSRDAVPKLYFAERSSGYLFSADLPTRDITRLTDTLRPQIYQALFSQDGSVVERSIDDTGALITFAGKAASSTPDATSSVAELVGLDLPQDISAIATDPISGTLFYLIPSASGVSLISSDWKGAKEKSLYASPLEGWRIYPTGGGAIALAQTAADGVPGFAYTLQKNGALLPLAQGPGLTILPKTGSSALLFGESSGNQLALFSQASASAQPVNLPIYTVADKCAWGPATVAYCGVPQSIPSQQFLDDWYKGLVHTTDAIWQIDTSDGTTTLLYSPQGSAGVSVDVENPSVDPTGNYMAFTNAADQSLWVLKILP